MDSDPMEWLSGAVSKYNVSIMENGSQTLGPGWGKSWLNWYEVDSRRVHPNQRIVFILGKQKPPPRSGAGLARNDHCSATKTQRPIWRLKVSKLHWSAANWLRRDVCPNNCSLSFALYFDMNLFVLRFNLAALCLPIGSTIPWLRFSVHCILCCHCLIIGTNEFVGLKVKCIYNNERLRTTDSGRW